MSSDRKNKTCVTGRCLHVGKQNFLPFAAKEAALKALQTGWSGGITWQDVEISAKESGAPLITFHGRALELYEASGATNAHVSIAHTTEHAIAEVILEKRDDGAVT